MINSYSELPILDYQKTSVAMTDVIEYLKTLKVSAELKRASYIVFRIESANGASGINNNYIGFQSDSGRWDAKYNHHFSGVCIKYENQTGKQRGFLCFNSWKDSVDILTSKLEDRGIYIGGTTHLITHEKVVSPKGLAIVYQKEWVKGNANYVPISAEINTFLNIYLQALKLFL